jgi:hypothetical protein
MRAVFITSITGWIACVLIGLEVLLPYIFRRNRLSQWIGTASSATGAPYLKRLWPHYWLGYLLLLLGVVHTVVPLQAGHLRQWNMAGLWIATVALLLLLLQGALGLLLQGSKLTGRAQMRSWHYWLMFGIVLLVGVHVWLNG